MTERSRGTSVRSGFLRALPIYILLATSIGYVDYHMRNRPDFGFTDYIPAVIHGTEPAPAKYRVLAPYGFAAFARVAPVDREEAWVLFRWLCLLFSWFACHALFTTWFEDGAAMMGTALVAALLPLTFTNGYPHPDHLVELGLFAAGVAAVARRSDWTFGVVLLLAALNRETSAFLVFLYALAQPISRSHLARVTLFAGLWATVYVGLRLALGFSSYNPWQIHQNLDFLRLSLAKPYDPYFRRYAWFGVLLIAGFAATTLMQWSVQPRITKVALLGVAPAFLLTAFCFSSLIEPRIFTPLLPILVPGIMFSVLMPKSIQRI